MLKSTLDDVLKKAGLEMKVNSTGYPAGGFGGKQSYDWYLGDYKIFTVYDDSGLSRRQWRLEDYSAADFVFKNDQSLYRLYSDILRKTPQYALRGKFIRDYDKTYPLEEIDPGYIEKRIDFKMHIMTKLKADIIKYKIEHICKEEF